MLTTYTFKFAVVRNCNPWAPKNAWGYEKGYGFSLDPITPSLRLYKPTGSVNFPSAQNAAYQRSM